MKNLSVIATVVAACSITLTANANNHGGGDVSVAPAVHHSSSAPTAPTTAIAPRYGGTGMARSYSSQAMPYRAVTTYHNGSRTLNYPAVGVSNVRHPIHSNAANLKTARASQQTAGGNLQKSSASLQRTGGGNSRRTGAVNFTAKHKLDPQTSERLRHWNGNVSSASQAHWNCHHHDHDWWKHHCIAFIFFDWGWWGWWDGWWYPDPYYYANYSEPIYGYGGLSPEEVVGSVQSALQQLGYYSYAVDGTMGPLTRAAIGRYQADNHLPITYTVDPATLGSLGIIR
jgi:Putative peptidoglycan binding domain